MCRRSAHPLTWPCVAAPRMQVATTASVVRPGPSSWPAPSVGLPPASNIRPSFGDAKDAKLNVARRLLGCMWDQGMVACARSAACRLLLHPAPVHPQHPHQAVPQPDSLSGSHAGDEVQPRREDVQLLCANPHVGWLIAQLRARGPGALEVLGRGQEGVVMLVREEGGSTSSRSSSSTEPEAAAGGRGGAGGGWSGAGGVLVKHMWHVAARVAAGGVAGHRAYLRSLPGLVPSGRWVQGPWGAFGSRHLRSLSPCPLLLGRVATCRGSKPSRKTATVACLLVGWNAMSYTAMLAAKRP